MACTVRDLGYRQKRKHWRARRPLPRRSVTFSCRQATRRTKVIVSILPRAVHLDGCLPVAQNYFVALLLLLPAPTSSALVQLASSERPAGDSSPANAKDLFSFHSLRPHRARFSVASGRLIPQPVSLPGAAPPSIGNAHAAGDPPVRPSTSISLNRREKLLWGATGMALSSFYESDAGPAPFPQSRLSYDPVCVDCKQISDRSLEAVVDGLFPRNSLRRNDGHVPHRVPHSAHPVHCEAPLFFYPPTNGFANRDGHLRCPPIPTAKIQTIAGMISPRRNLLLGFASPHPEYGLNQK